MKERLAITILLLALPAGFQQPVTAQQTDVPAMEFGGTDNSKWRTAPDFELTNRYGAPVKLSDFRGRVVVLQFWARYCTSCEGDLRVFQRVREKKTEQEVVILGLGHASGSRGEIKEFADRLAITFPMLLCTEPVRFSYGVAVFPTTFLVDRQGRIRYRRVGALSPDFWEEMIDQLGKQKG